MSEVNFVEAEKILEGMLAAGDIASLTVSSDGQGQLVMYASNSEPRAEIRMFTHLDELVIHEMPKVIGGLIPVDTSSLKTKGDLEQLLRSLLS